MHDTALLTGQKFFELYAADAESVLDVGSSDVNGTLRPFVPSSANYCGLDIAAGKNVTLVLTNPYQFPITNDEFDVVVSSSCLEHTQFFWLTFVEMVRAARRWIYVSAPMAGPVHRHPVDCWRFFPDSGKALAQWASYNRYDIRLVESFILPPRREGWFDFVAVFNKNGAPRRGQTIASFFPEATEKFEAT